jgi:hypothetical protein
MALVEGGDFNCSTHNFKTTKISDWNKHCLSSPHFEYGTTICSSCKANVEFAELPFAPLDQTGSKNISLLCETCDTKIKGKVSVKKVVKSVSQADNGGK